jgi:hypothetical protein
MDMAFDAPQGQEIAPASGVANNVPRTRRRSTSPPMPRCTGMIDKAVKAMTTELVDMMVWPKKMDLNTKQVMARVLAQVLVPIHAAMRHTGVNDEFSDIVNRVAVLERTDKDDLFDRLPFQDLRARVLTLEERISELEVCVSEVRVPSGEASVSAAYKSSPTELVEEYVKRAQQKAATRRQRSPSPLMRPVHEHGTDSSAMLLTQSAITELLKAGVIKEGTDGRLVRNQQMRHQPQHQQEAPDTQVQPQTQTQTAPQMMMVEGQQWQPQMQPQQTAVPVQVWWQ